MKIDPENVIGLATYVILGAYLMVPANITVRAGIWSMFGGMVEEQVSGLAVHLRYLAQVLDAYDKHCLKSDHFV